MSDDRQIDVILGDIDRLLNETQDSKQNMWTSQEYEETFSTSFNTNPSLLVSDDLVPLHPGTDVFISKKVKTLAHLQANRKPKKLLALLLDALYSKEELAQLSARGQRNSRQLPPNVHNALNLYLYATCTREGWRPILTDAQFNAEINGRCGIARRAVKRKFEGTESELGQP